jgi:hypothetical protein
MLRQWAGAVPPEVYTTGAERECLACHARGRRRVVEVGVWHGGTARVLREAMAADGLFFAVDPYLPGRFGVSGARLIARRVLATPSTPRVIWIRERGCDAARGARIRAASPFDFVFLDPPQTSAIVRAEWEAWTPLVGPWGILALHDSRPSEEDPEFAPDSLSFANDVARRDERFEIIDEVGLLTVFRRR